MDKTRVFILALGIVILLDTALADIQLVITRPNDGEKFKTDFNGNILLNVSVKNTGNEQALEVKLDIDSHDMGFQVGNNNQSIAQDTIQSFNVKGFGLQLSTPMIRVRINAVGKTADGVVVTSDSITIIIYPPLLKAKIIAPIGVMRIVSPQTGDLNFQVWVENKGEADLGSVELIFEPVRGNVSCTYSGPQGVRRGDKVSYEAQCSGIKEGDAIRIRAYDSDKLSKDMEIISFSYVVSLGKPDLEITGPKDGQNITVSEEEVISVIVKNNGTRKAEDVCVNVKNLSVYDDNCSDIEPGESHTFVFEIREMPTYVLSSTIEAASILNNISDQISVKIRPPLIMVQTNLSSYGTFWFGENLPDWLKSANESPDSKNTSLGNGTNISNQTPGGGASSKESGGFFNLSGGDFNLLVIGTVAAILGFYLIMGVRGIVKKSKKKASKELAGFDREQQIEQLNKELGKSRPKESS